MLDTEAGPIELDESGIPERLRPRARAWFTREIAACARAHGPKWPEHREWVLDYMRAELRELVAAEVAKHAG
jgi:hypothetical protein